MLVPRKALVATLSSQVSGAISEVEVTGLLAWVGEYDLADSPEGRVGDRLSAKFGAIIGLAFIGGFGVFESGV